MLNVLAEMILIYKLSPLRVRTLIFPRHGEASCCYKLSQCLITDGLTCSSDLLLEFYEPKPETGISESHFFISGLAFDEDTLKVLRNLLQTVRSVALSLNVDHSLPIGSSLPIRNRTEPVRLD